MIRIGSVCSGTGGAELAFAGLAHSAFMAEIDPFARAVLKHRFPEIPLHGDFTTIRSGDYETIDVLVGGTPCQSFSIAGLRRGLADARGNLALEFLRLADRLRPWFILWENVPGVRSSRGGRDFGAFLGGLGELGYGWAYRSFDAQFAGLAQRRERVFVVGCAGDWRSAAAVLAFTEGLRWHPAPRREAREGVARPLGSCLEGGSGYRNDADTAENLAWRGDGCDNFVAFDYKASASQSMNPGPLVPTLNVGRADGSAIAYGGNNTSGAIDIATAVNAHGGPNGRCDFESETFVTHALRAGGFDAGEDGTRRGTPLVVALHENQRAEITMSDTAGSLKTGGGKPGQGYPAAFRGSQIRRLTVTECERLQGLPDSWTDIPWRGKPHAPDGPRYRAIGNGFAIPCVRWIAERITAAVEHELAARTASVPGECAA
jgi:DNA (cytosine-5)-methyltransferase 1